MSKNKVSQSGIVYSTDPGFRQEEETEENVSMPADKQQLTIKLDSKQRAGKLVTIIMGYVGTSSDREEIARKIKAYCGTGGSVKDKDIIIQGNNKDKIVQWLLKNHFKQVRKM